MKVVKEKYNQLWDAVQTDQLGNVKNIVQGGVKLEYLDNKQAFELLMSVVGDISFEIFEYLGENGADIKVVSEGSRQNLFFYVKDPDAKKKMEYLLSKGVDINARDKDGQTPLHRIISGFAGQEDKLKIAGRLIDCGADINAQTPSRSTPLILATLHGQTELVKLLIERGADLSLEDKEGKTAYYYAHSQAEYNKNDDSQQAEVYKEIENLLDKAMGTETHVGRNTSIAAGVSILAGAGVILGLKYGTEVLDDKRALYTAIILTAVSVVLISAATSVISMCTGVKSPNVKDTGQQQQM